MRFLKHTSKVFEYPCGENYSSCYPLNFTLYKGWYSLEVWGASGGSNDTEHAGKGGYAYGILSLQEETEIYIYLGGKGVISTTDDQPTPEIFNGGGTGCKYPRHYFDGSGGGASDIRISGHSLNHRIIVAGGGGGTGYDYNYSIGGFGGGINGGNGEKGYNRDNYQNPTQHGTGGEGGKQTGNIEFFGIGENHTGGEHNAGGGGGGWFGGHKGEAFGAGGGGGSGFVYTHNNDLVNLSSQYYLKEGLLLGGNELIPSPNSSDYELGHYGSGTARISILVPQCTIFVQSIYNSHITIISLMTIISLQSTNFA